MGERIAKASKVPLWGPDGVDCFHKVKSGPLIDSVTAA
jgi:hypothetical protein